MLKIITLGTGNAFAHANSYQSAHYLEFNGRKILLDCGPSILNAKQNAELDLFDLDCILISHLHGDHMAGLPFLLLDFKYSKIRSDPIDIYGPVGLSSQLDFAIKGSYPNLLPKENLFNVTEIGSEKRFQLFEDIQLLPFNANHIENALCYRIDHEGLSVVYSGDNELSDSQLKYLDNTTVLIHELSAMKDYFKGHTSWDKLKENIDEIEKLVNYVIFVHTSQEVRNEPKESFPSNMIRAQDGSIFEFNAKGRLYQMII